MVFLTISLFSYFLINFKIIYVDVLIYFGYFLLAFFISTSVGLILAWFIFQFFSEKLKNAFSEILLFFSTWPFAIYLVLLLPITSYYLLFAFYVFFPLGQWLKILQAPTGLRVALYSFGASRRHFVKALFSHGQRELGIVLYLHFLRISSDFLSFLYLRNYLTKKIFWHEVLWDSNFFILLLFNLFVYVFSLIYLIFYPKKIQGDFLD